MLSSFMYELGVSGNSSFGSKKKIQGDVCKGGGDGL